MIDLVVPKLNNNDTSYTLVEWLFDDGDVVRGGDTVAVLETSKAAADLETHHEGVLHRLLPQMAECGFGDVIARIFASERDRQEFLASSRPATAPEPANAPVVITKAARELAEREGIDQDRLLALGKPVVKQSDVEQLLTGQGDAAAATTEPLSRSQRAIGAVVTESHRSIPAALAVVKVHVDPALALARRLSRETGQMIGLPDILIRCLAGLRPQFPPFFATLADGDRALRPAQAADIGVTVDLGTGLFVPVLRDVEHLGCAQIAASLMDFRERALAGGFQPHELTGANIMVSLHAEPDVVLAGPIIYPGQTGVVCLAGVSHELVLDDVGEVAVRRVVNISLVYDHRVVNGREAVAFLQALKAAVQSGTDPATGR